MSSVEQASNDLFFKLRNRFARISMVDGNNQATMDPRQARFINFDYEDNDIKFGNITASLVDDSNLKLFFSQDITQYMDNEEKQNWYKFLQEIRKFAKSHMLGLDIRDINKDALSSKDLKFMTDHINNKNLIGESRVLWARRGKVSEGTVNNIKVHVVHSERMDENPNNRLLRVDRIFLETQMGERFLLPFKSVMGAKAMANHVALGGNPYDQNGRTIINAVNEMANLRRFVSATRRKTFESEDANQVIDAAKAIKESIKRSLFRLSNNSRFDENISDLNNLLAEQTDLIDIKPFFMQNIYNENLDNWISSAAKAYKNYKENVMENLRESAGTVAQKLSDPNWRLILKDEPSEDRLIASSKYSDGRALLRRVLGTIADRIGMDDSDVANWASQIGQDMEDGKASREDMQIALQLAKRYQDDLKQIMSNPDAAKELRASAFGQRRTLNRKAKTEDEQFENWVQGLGEDDMEEDAGEMMDEIAQDEAGMDMAVEDEHLDERNAANKLKKDKAIQKIGADNPDDRSELRKERGMKTSVSDKIRGREITQQTKDRQHPYGHNAEMDEDQPVIVQDPKNPLPPMSAMDRIQQKLGIGAFAPQTPQPINTQPLPGSPGPSQSDKDALKGIIDTGKAPSESEEEMNETLSSILHLAGLKKKLAEADVFTKYSPLDDIVKNWNTEPKMSNAPEITMGAPTGTGFTMQTPQGSVSGTGTNVGHAVPQLGAPDPSERWPSAQAAPNIVGQVISKIAPKLALPLALATPTDQLAGPEKDEFNYAGKKQDSQQLMFNPTDIEQQKFSSMPVPDVSGTKTGATLPPSAFSAAPTKYEDAIDSLNQLKNLAGIGK